jgi:lipopolysaccharide transport system ATP-binding protein
MSDRPVISVENLGKTYRISHQGGGRPYEALRDVIADKFRRLFRPPPAQPDAGAAATTEDFWALRDVSFEVRQGEVIGIIGRNGAGKSTLLKILSRITEPSEGRVRIRGRVASLLEVGTGFHPELTGRENIHLNGAILGMSRAEIRRKFDEIVAFAEVDKFLDTPVKRYSSGMYVRLAFAVAAHLDPEILIVDEVLAVGDAQFQKKCLGKMQDVAKGGRTVLFVSHNMMAVQSLCTGGLLLKQGRISCAGGIAPVLDSYLREQKVQNVNFEQMASTSGRLGNGRARFTKLFLTDVNGGKMSEVSFGSDFFICGQIANKTGGEVKLSVAFAIAKSGGDIIFASHHDDEGARRQFSSETLDWKASLTPNILKPGLYSIHLGITDEDWNCVDYIPDCLTFEVLPLVESKTSAFLDKRPGLILPPKIAWEITEL